jgi:protocatechuate 3,4-dioxygenase beta subunit
MEFSFFPRRNFLIGTASSTLIGCSISRVSNVTEQNTLIENKEDIRKEDIRKKYCQQEAWKQDGAYNPQSCIPTTSDIEGPFYLPEAPLRNNFNLYGDSGTSLQMNGQLFAQDSTNCRIPIFGTIEFWHADPNGSYDNTSAEMKYRGLVQTDKKGLFNLITLLPGRYLNGSLYRPRHIHVKIYNSKNKEVLTTQLYFKGDPYLPCDSFAGTSRVLPFTGNEQSGITVSNLVFVI